MVNMSFPVEFWVQNFLGAGSCAAFHTIDAFFVGGYNDVPTFHYRLLCNPKSLGTHHAVTFLRFKSSRIMRQIVLRLTLFVISSRINNPSCQTVKWQSSSSNACTLAIVSVLRASLGLPSRSSLVTFVRPSLNKRIHFLTVCTDTIRSPYTSQSSW